MQMTRYAMRLPPVMADDEPMVRTILTAHAANAGWRIAEDAPIDMRVVTSRDDCLAILVAEADATR